MSRYKSEADKVRELPHVMKYMQGLIYDIGCGADKLVPDAIGIDGRQLDGVDVVCDSAGSVKLLVEVGVFGSADVVFSSHFLEHLPNQHEAIVVWASCLKKGGYLILYLPDGNHYNNRENPEHMVDMKHDDFMFWFRRAFCGEGKDFRGDNLVPLFELVDHGMDLRPDCYSFYVIAKKK